VDDVLEVDGDCAEHPREHDVVHPSPATSEVTWSLMV
jgi:hypothetical protein